MKKLFFLVNLLWLVSGFALADDRPSENEMFGGTSSVATPAPAASSPDTMAGKSHSFLASAEENTQIGGTLSNEADYYLTSGVPLLQNTTVNPNILFLYLDSKLEDDARVFARIRTYYDPSGLTGGNPNFGTNTNLLNPYGF